MILRTSTLNLSRCGSAPAQTFMIRPGTLRLPRSESDPGNFGFVLSRLSPYVRSVVHAFRNHPLKALYTPSRKTFKGCKVGRVGYRGGPFIIGGKCFDSGADRPCRELE